MKATDQSAGMLAASTGAFLHAVGPLEYLSWLFGALCVFEASQSDLGSVRTLLGVGALASVWVSWWALRLRFDARLFDALSARLTSCNVEDDVLSDLDTALIQLGLIRSSGQRDLMSRALGARRISLFVIVGVVLQGWLLLCVGALALLM